MLSLISMSGTKRTQTHMPHTVFRCNFKLQHYFVFNLKVLTTENINSDTKLAKEGRFILVTDSIHSIILFGKLLDCLVFPGSECRMTKLKWFVQ